MRVYHILPALLPGDAVGNDARALNDLLVEMGWHSRLYSPQVPPRLPLGLGRKIEELPETFAEDVLIYHLATGCDLNEQFGELPGHKMIVYHNMTPPQFFAPYDAQVAQLLVHGYEQIEKLATKVEYCITPSAYNKRELQRMGYTCPVDVVPILIPFEDYARTPDTAVQQMYRDGRTNILFVGRVAPNKRFEDVITAFDCYKRNYDPTARLFLVGGFAANDPYYRSLHSYCKRLGVTDVIFPGHIRFEEILAYYTVADLFLCMSDHEGFCVPLVEAMYFGVPIVAKDTTAVGDTMGQGGLLLPDQNPQVAATAIHRILSDKTLKATIETEQKKRLADFQYEKIAQQFRESFGRFLAQRGSENE